MLEDRLTCHHCGLPVRRRPRQGSPPFCCLGCRLAQEITGARGEESQARIILALLLFSSFLAMGMMMFSTLLYAEEWFPTPGGNPLGPLAPWIRWTAAGFSAPLFFLLSWPIARGFFFGTATAVDALILLGSASAMSLSAINLLRGEGEVHVETGAMVLLLFTLGRYLEARARARVAGEARSILELSPERARRIVTAPERGSGTAPNDSTTDQMVPTAEVMPGDRLRVLPGERIPADGEIVSGCGTIDNAPVTGESGARDCSVGDKVKAGTLNLDGDLEMEVAAGAGDRWIDHAARFIEEARRRRGSLERLADEMSKFFLPAAAIAALATFFFWLPDQGALEALLRSLAVLLVACPCALGLATPLAILGALDAAAGEGVLVRGGEAIEGLARLRAIVFDKTGTITQGSLKVSEVVPAPGKSAGELLEVAGALGRSSVHPISLAIAAEAERRGVRAPEVTDGRAFAGLGVSGWIGGERALLGSRRFVENELGRAIGEATERTGDAEKDGSLVLASRGENLLGCIVTREALRPEAPQALRALRRLGLHVEVLTGDSPRRGDALREQLQVPVRAGLLPMEKVERIQSLAEIYGPVAMVGDGINDAPGLAAAHVGIALSSGVDITKEAADAILLGSDGGAGLGALPRLVELSRATLVRVRWILVWAFAYNVAGMAIAAAGLLGPATAAVLMMASSLTVVAMAARSPARGKAKVPRETSDRPKRWVSERDSQRSPEPRRSLRPSSGIFRR